MAKLLAKQPNVMVTIATTPLNATRYGPALVGPIVARLAIQFLELPFEAGLPEGLHDKIELTRKQLPPELNTSSIDTSEFRERAREAELIELGLGLEASNHPFIWVIRSILREEEIQEWLTESGFEERVKDRGLIIRGSVCAGVPMITWPQFAEQFINEKLLVRVFGAGVGVGVDPVAHVGEEDMSRVKVKREDVKKASEKAMDDGIEGHERRKRAKELGKIANNAIKEGGDLVSKDRNVEEKLLGLMGNLLNQEEVIVWLVHVSMVREKVYSCLDGNEDIFGGAKSDTNVSLVKPLSSGDLEAIEKVELSGGNSNTKDSKVLTGIHMHGNLKVEPACSQYQCVKDFVEVCQTTQAINDPMMNMGNKTRSMSTKEVPITYATKLSPTVNLENANFCKLEASVPEDADYDFDLPIASFHEHVFRFKGRSSYARALIEINACNEFRENLVMVVPKLEDGNEDIFGGAKSDTNVSLVKPLSSGDLEVIEKVVSGETIDTSESNDSTCLYMHGVSSKELSGGNSNTKDSNVLTGIHMHENLKVEPACSQYQCVKDFVEVCQTTQAINDPMMNMGIKTRSMSTKEVPIKYATKLSPTVNLENANFCKLEASVPEDADYDFDLPIASFHEHVFRFKGRSSSARALIEINACNEFRENLVMVVPKLEGFIVVTKKKSGDKNGNKNSKRVSWNSKFAYRPKAVKLAKGPSVSYNTTKHVDTNGASISGCNKDSTMSLSKKKGDDQKPLKPCKISPNPFYLLSKFDDSNDDGKDDGKSILHDLQESDNDAEVDNVYDETSTFIVSK
ncbi:UDP-glucuronosyl/UDP-glucosyltransferase [Artemisia annua]|uniref:UDP-glucuronosyl/UDP-glucosyltransferase n=1 Tax=Artemisia annua TaxID=35608 RepID=A0A2U1MED1_ARTAN|nr:UDP-glucuronosyl/UDP-glucosyltransferase [Artemisia annua]